MLYVEYMYCWGGIEIYRRILNFLDIWWFAGRRNVLFRWTTLWGIKIHLAVFFSWTYLGTLEDRTIKLLRQLFIAPVSSVTRNEFLCFVCKYSWVSKLLSMHTSQIEPWTFFAKQNREKEKYLARLTENTFLLIFEWPENRRFVYKRLTS